MWMTLWAELLRLPERAGRAIRSMCSISSILSLEKR
jgi:hypothetical protein